VFQLRLVVTIGFAAVKLLESTVHDTSDDEQAAAGSMTLLDMELFVCDGAEASAIYL
jgi:hypothetical protein